MKDLISGQYHKLNGEIYTPKPPHLDPNLAPFEPIQMEPWAGPFNLNDEQGLLFYHRSSTIPINGMYIVQIDLITIKPINIFHGKIAVALNQDVPYTNLPYKEYSISNNSVRMSFKTSGPKNGFWIYIKDLWKGQEYFTDTNSYFSVQAVAHYEAFNSLKRIDVTLSSLRIVSGEFRIQRCESTTNFDWKRFELSDISDEFRIQNLWAFTYLSFEPENKSCSTGWWYYFRNLSDLGFNSTVVPKP